MNTTNKLSVAAIGALATIGAGLTAAVYMGVKMDGTPGVQVSTTAKTPPTMPVTPPVGTAHASYLPDPVLTPGKADPALTLAVMTAPGWSTKSIRDVPTPVKDAVYKRYGIDPRHHAPAEIDHLASLELGGSNTSDPKAADYLQNLWPESYDLNVNGYQMGAREKDKAESATARAVRAGKISLADAQKQICNDWTVLYRRFVSPTFPVYKVPAP